MSFQNPGHQDYKSIIVEIEKGQIKIPQFQRNFVWDLNGSAKLLDSILKNYPIGTFIFWRTNERLRSVRNIGNIDLPEPRDGEYVTYVLDGQQRLTSLYASLKGAKIKREGKHETDYALLYVDLMVENDDPIVITDISERNEKEFISINDLLKDDFELLASYPDPQKTRLKKYLKNIQSYAFSIIEVKDAPLDIATDIFTRINVGGKSLTLFEVMVAKTYDSGSGFDLAEKFKQLTEELEDSKFETIPAATVLQVLAIIHTKDCTRKSILKIPKKDFIEKWDESVDSIKFAIDYFRTFYKVPVSRLLPYYALLVPFSYFFYKYKQKPVGEMQKRLEDFFWRASIGARYTSGVESKLASDVEKIDKIINGDSFKYEWTVNITPQFIEDNGWFSTGRSYIKAILAIYASKKPHSFDDNAEVIVDNSWLKIASSKNYHHFFPKDFLKKNRPDLDIMYINHIANITIVDDNLNKNKIRAKPPSKYIAEFKKHNDSIEETLKTHLIGPIGAFGIENDDYDKFFNKRISLISKEFEKRIILTEADNHVENLGEDYEEFSTDIEIE